MRTAAIALLFGALTFILPRQMATAEVPTEQGAPIVPFEQVLALIESLQWSSLHIAWRVVPGDYAPHLGPNIIIARMEDKVVLHYENGPRESNPPSQRTLSKDEQRSICKKLTEFMAIARKEVDIHESLRGLSPEEKEARIRKIFGDTVPGFGITEFGYSLTIGKGGQTLSFGDSFSGNSNMQEWMKSLKEAPKANN